MAGSSPDPLVARLRAAGCVHAEEEAALLAAEHEGPQLEAGVRRRVAGEPLEQVLGWAAFDGLRVRLLPGVFVPRRSSEVVPQLGEQLLRGRRGPIVVDLCCGSGALGAALAARLPAAEVHATDLDPDAVACARLNLPSARVHQGDLYDALPRRLAGRVSLLCVHAPYVPSSQVALLPREARLHEHLLALDGGPDGLAVQRAVAGGAPRWLAADGVLLLETSPSARPGTLDVLLRAGLDVEAVHEDDEGLSVVVEARRAGVSNLDSDAGPTRGRL